MPKIKQSGVKKGSQLRHYPLGSDMQRHNFAFKQSIVNDDNNASNSNAMDDDDYNDYDDDDDEENLTKKDRQMIFSQAREQQRESTRNKNTSLSKMIDGDNNNNNDNDDNDDDDGWEDEGDEEIIDDDDNIDDEFVELDGEYVGGVGLSTDEEAVVNRFLHAGKSETRTLADIILEKIKEREENARNSIGVDDDDDGPQIPPKVIEVYTAVGKILSHYKAGKLPKALKMLPHLRNWEDVLWITRPDGWSPTATYACTRIFCSNLNVKMAQRFLNMVLLEKCREDIRVHNKLNYHLYMALKKALFKPAAFYKGLLLPLAQSGTCTLREATIIGSVLAKVSVPGDHSAAALIRLAEMEYSGSTSLFLRVLLNKKYALPRKVLEALVTHFFSFERDQRVLPVIWHTSLLVFVQRYKKEFDESQKERFKLLLRAHQHHQITPEIRRELFQNSI